MARLYGSMLVCPEGMGGEFSYRASYYPISSLHTSTTPCSQPQGCYLQAAGCCTKQRPFVKRTLSTSSARGRGYQTAGITAACTNQPANQRPFYKRTLPTPSARGRGYQTTAQAQTNPPVLNARNAIFPPQAPVAGATKQLETQRPAQTNPQTNAPFLNAHFPPHAPVAGATKQPPAQTNPPV